jgi:iron complex outermembrane recepter protein
MRKRRIASSRLWLSVTCFAVLASGSAHAERSIAEQADAETEVGRTPTQVLKAPLAISIVSSEEITRAKPAVDLADALELVPGAFVQSAGNFSQDARVSIRGFGARAQFGIRDVRLRIDDVPATLPDGQSEVDSLDLAFVDRIDVLRGSVSSLYGGAGGGLVSIRTLAPSEDTRTRLRTVIGSGGVRRHEGSVSGTFAGNGYVVGLAQTRSAGYRAHSRAEQTALLLKLQRELDDGSQLRIQLSSTWAPEAQDPGGLSRAERRRDRDAAAVAARTFDASEKLDQQKLSFSWERPLGTGRSLGVQGYRIRRGFSNNLALARSVEFDRAVTGAALVYREQRGPLRFLAGVDFDVQRDLRRNHENVGGARGGIILDQNESVRALGPFAEVEIDVSDQLSTTFGLRYDRVTFDVGDRLVDAQGDQSDRVHFRELSPRFALRYSVSQALHLHASAAGGFGVPTTTELRPVSGVGGFDGDREAERSLTYEIGAKGALGDRLLYEVTLFDIRVNDVLVPFGVNGDQFFRNAGEVHRRGVELAFSARLAPGWTARTSYTYADYRYRDFDKDASDLDGNREPNVPMHAVGAELRYDSPRGMFAVLALRHFSDLEVDDENRNESDGATLGEVRVGYRYQRGALSVEPFVSLRNLSGARYDGTTRPNAAAGRFFEPAPERQIFAGAELRF